MIYPVESLRELAQHPLLQGFWNPVPEILSGEDWPDCAYWQQKLEEQPSFSSLPHPLHLLPEVKIGQRRKRKLAKLKREDNRPTLRRYESSIIEDHQIPMRERNLHDYFNALIWMRFPKAKYALHERAYRSYLDGGPVTGNLRNDLTDALTRFDEGGVVCFEGEGFAVFGHGLLEVWLQGGRNLTACLLPIARRPEEDQDLALARVLREMGEPYGRFGTVGLDGLLGNELRINPTEDIG